STDTIGVAPRRKTRITKPVTVTTGIGAFHKKVHSARQFSGLRISNVICVMRETIDTRTKRGFAHVRETSCSDANYPTPWKPSDLPTLRAAYSDRTAALMAYLAAFAYDTRIEAKGGLQVPQELAAFGFNTLTSFHNGMTDGWAYIAEGTDL